MAKKVKTCTIVNSGGCYHWDGISIAAGCLLGVAAGKSVFDYETEWLEITGRTMTGRLTDAISALDNDVGDKTDVDCIRRAAPKVGVRIKVVRA